MVTWTPLNPERARKPGTQHNEVFVYRRLHRRDHQSPVLRATNGEGEEIAIQNTKIRSFHTISFITQILSGVKKKSHKAALLAGNSGSGQSPASGQPKLSKKSL